jgi:hypothetical protein
VGGGSQRGWKGFYAASYAVLIGNPGGPSYPTALSKPPMQADPVSTKRKAAFLEPELRPVSGLQRCASDSMALGTREVNGNALGPPEPKLSAHGHERLWPRVGEH